MANCCFWLLDIGNVEQSKKKKNKNKKEYLKFKHYIKVHLYIHYNDSEHFAENPIVLSLTIA